MRGLLVLEAELLDFLAAVFREPGRECGAVLLQVGFNTPVFPWLEGFNLSLPLANHSQRRALYPAGRQTLTDFLPQQWRQVEPNQVVQGPPGLLGVYQIGGQSTWVVDGILHRAFGDLVEHDAMHVLAFQGTAFLE